MPNEASKNHNRRVNNGDFEKYFVGKGIDIGAGSDPVVEGCDVWDKPQGDAALLVGLQNDSYDFVHASHCLEHFAEPEKVLARWWEILKPGGHLIVTVPDWFLYEKKTWPSKGNADHKSIFTVQSLCWLASQTLVMHGGQIIRVQLNDTDFDYSDHETDQTTKATTQAEIELIVRKQKDVFWCA